MAIDKPVKAEKTEKTDAPVRRRIVRRRKKVCAFCANEGISLREARSFQEELPAIVQSIREL